MAEREEITVRAELRAGRGKNDARRLRARGMVPLTPAASILLPEGARPATTTAVLHEAAFLPSQSATAR